MGCRLDGEASQLNPTPDPAFQATIAMARAKTATMEEARRLIEEYADDLREIVEKLRRHLN